MAKLEPNEATSWNFFVESNSKTYFESRFHYSCLAPQIQTLFVNKLFLLGVGHFLFNRLRESSPSSFLLLKPIFYWYSGNGLPKLTNKKAKQLIENFNRLRILNFWPQINKTKFHSNSEKTNYFVLIFLNRFIFRELSSWNSSWVPGAIWSRWGHLHCSCPCRPSASRWGCRPSARPPRCTSSSPASGRWSPTCHRRTPVGQKLWRHQGSRHQ